MFFIRLQGIYWRSLPTFSLSSAITDRNRTGPRIN